MKYEDYGAYIIECPDKSLYVGASHSVHYRLKTHRYCSTNKKLKESIKKYGWRNHNKYLIKRIDGLYNQWVESYLMLYLKLKGFNLLNIKVTTKCSLNSKSSFKRKYIEDYHLLKNRIEMIKYKEIEEMSTLEKIAYDCYDNYQNWDITERERQIEQLKTRGYYWNKK